MYTRGHKVKSKKATKAYKKRNSNISKSKNIDVAVHPFQRDAVGIKENKSTSMRKEVNGVRRIKGIEILKDPKSSSVLQSRRAAFTLREKRKKENELYSNIVGKVEEITLTPPGTESLPPIDE